MAYYGVSAKRNTAAARAFFEHAISAAGTAPAEAVSDPAPVYRKLLDELVPAAWHHSEQYGNNKIEAGHGQLKRRLRPMRQLPNAGTGSNAPRILGENLAGSVCRPHKVSRPLVPSPRSGRCFRTLSCPGDQ